MTTRTLRVAAVMTALAASGLFGGAGLAAENPRHKKEMRAIREVVEENFRTSNNEDLTSCMATMTPYMPNREEFVSQLKEFFEETNVYIRLVALQFVSAEMADHGPAAAVRVPSRRSQKETRIFPTQSFGREVPCSPWEVCEFDLVIHKSHEKSHIHKITGNVREAQLPKK